MEHEVLVMVVVVVILLMEGDEPMEYWWLVEMASLVETMAK